MGFYDRSLIQAVANAPRTYGTLDVVPMGGGAFVTDVFSDTSLHTILPAPPVGYSYRLHLFTSGPGGTLLGLTSNAFYCVANTPGTFLLGGLLCNEGLVNVNSSPAAARITLFYDTILTPYVS